MCESDHNNMQPAPHMCTQFLFCSTPAGVVAVSCDNSCIVFLSPSPPLKQLAGTGTAGGEAQQNDIKVLRRELELKKTKLNELREEARRKETLLSRNQDDNTDAARMTPGELSEEQAFVRELQDEMKRIDEELVEAEAKNRLYYLLGERTR